jgi:hypothetical protein
MVAEPDWASMPEKRCFAPCPRGVPCECRERARALRLRDGTFTTLDLEDDDKEAKIIKKY